LVRPVLPLRFRRAGMKIEIANNMAAGLVAGQQRMPSA